MSMFVLVHPAWFGGWCWKKVLPGLRSAGHTVYTPTLTGLGERAHLAGPHVSLSTHIDDIVAVLLTEDLCEVTLVGNSSAGTVITGVADRVPERVQRIIYLDAFVPTDGHSTSDLVAPDRWAAMQQLAAAEGNGWLLPRFAPLPWDRFIRNAWHVAHEDVPWIVPRLRPTPLRHFTESIRLHTNGNTGISRVYIRCTANTSAPHFDQCASTAQSTTGWTYRELALPHLPFITHPDETAAVLLDVTK